MGKNITLAKALQEAMDEEMRANPDVILIGESIKVGGMWGNIKEVLAEFGEERIFSAPIAENGYCGLGTGLAMGGKRPVVELCFGDFLMLSMDAIVGQAAKYTYQSGPEFKVPMVIRAAGTGVGTGFGIHHAQAVESWIMPYPGITIVTPATPNDAKGLMKAAIRSDNPVVFVEYKTVYGKVGEIIDDGPIEIGKARIAREGSDVTIVTYGPGYYYSMGAAKRLEEDGVSAEIIDLRTIKPYDKETILNSVKKTGRLITVEDCCKTNCVGSEIIAFVCENALGYLDASVVRVAGVDTTIPAGKMNEFQVVPNEDDVYNAVKNMF